MIEVVLKIKKKSAEGLTDHVANFATQKNKPLHKILLAYLSECENTLYQYTKAYVHEYNLTIEWYPRRPIIRECDIPTKSVITKKTSPVHVDSSLDTTSCITKEKLYKISDTDSVDVTSTSVMSSVTGSLNSTTNSTINSLSTSNTSGMKRGRIATRLHPYDLY